MFDFPGAVHVRTSINVIFVFALVVDYHAWLFDVAGGRLKAALTSRAIQRL